MRLRVLMGSDAVIEGPAPAPAAPQRPSGRSSGLVAAGASATRSREKMVWEWPEVSERVIEEWR